MHTIHIILGSTRPERLSEKVGQYLVGALKKESAIQVELIDLRDWPLPFYDEAKTPTMLHSQYQNPLARKWAAKVAEADGYVIVTPEYNHGYSAVLKNALDWVFYEWNQKPVGFASYGSALGARAVEQLRQVAVELQLVPIRSALHLPREIFLAIREAPMPVDPTLFQPLREGPFGDRVGTFLTELLAMADALKPLRQ